METLSSQPLQQANYYDRELLYRAKQNQCFYNAGQKKNLRARDGNTIRWRRFNALAVNTSTLVEGVTPTGTALSMTEVTATVAQYGQYGEVTDMMDLVGIDPVIEEAVAVFGQQAGESIDTVVANIMSAGTSVMYATGSARATQAAANVITVALIRKAVRNLARNNTLRFSGGEDASSNSAKGFYMAFLSPSATYDLKNDTEWKNMQQQVRPESLVDGSIGQVEKCQIIESTLTPIFTGQGSGGVDVHGTMIMGMNAFGVVDVGGTGKFKTFVKQVGSAGAADPLDQRGTIGWKSTFVSKMLNDNFLTRIEHGVSL